MIKLGLILRGKQRLVSPHMEQEDTKVSRLDSGDPDNITF